MEILSQSEMKEVPIPSGRLIALIGDQVLRLMGTPADVFKVKVFPVGNDHYRVNVLVGKSLGTARIGKSYFLTTDAMGNVLDSRPRIVRQG